MCYESDDQRSGKSLESLLHVKDDDAKEQTLCTQTQTLMLWKPWNGENELKGITEHYLIALINKHERIDA
jgi:hypothetical protein